VYSADHQHTCHFEYLGEHLTKLFCKKVKLVMILFITTHFLMEKLSSQTTGKVDTNDSKSLRYSKNKQFLRRNHVTGEFHPHDSARSVPQYTDVSCITETKRCFLPIFPFREESSPKDNYHTPFRHDII
jgi:hypothetical protein